MSETPRNLLYRGSQTIPVEKEPEYFTAIMPSRTAVEEYFKLPEVDEMNNVFHRVYKIKAKEEYRDELMAKMRQDDIFQPICHHAYSPVGDAATRYYLTDMLVLGFAKGVTAYAKEAILQQHGLKYVKSYDLEQDLVLLQVTATSGKNPVKVSQDLNEQPEVLFAEPNLINRFETYYQPIDTLFPYQWHLESKAGLELVAEAGIQTTKAWDITKGSRSVIIGIIDDGFDLSHPDLMGVDKVKFPKDFVDKDESPLPETTTGDYHGTPCAGVAIGEENGQGILGIAPGCSFMPVRFPLAADDNLMYDIFDYAGKRAHVLSCSWGPVPVYAPLPTLLYNQISDLTSFGGPNGKGCLIFFAAGNYNAPIKDLNNRGFSWRHPTQGIKTTTGAIWNGYAAHPAVVCVAASNSLNKKSAYSNWGREISLCSPSDNWHPLDPQERLPGRGIWTTDNESSGYGFAPGSRYTSMFGGTSSATPLAAGVAGLIRSIAPQLTAEEVHQRLLESVDKIIDTEPDVVLGHAKGTYNANGHSEWFGYGKINALRALTPFAPQPVEPVEAPEPEADTTEEIEIPVARPDLKGKVKILAALVNPIGAESGAEKVLLINLSPDELDLSRCKIRDKSGRSDELSQMSVSSGATAVITLSKAKLANTGGDIILLDSQDELLHDVTYGQAEASKAGWWILF
ncbi:MAG TPA: S8 family serine peptidase [Saprospiraceae bacterium]|nr:S8 family serine peptidase [Saprospiraceae bacterium]HMQ81487.1 S8 family serine peptidase [Saprospiraceae bacterium]